MNIHKMESDSSLNYLHYLFKQCFIWIFTLIVIIRGKKQGAMKISKGCKKKRKKHKKRAFFILNYLHFVCTFFTLIHLRKRNSNVWPKKCILSPFFLFIHKPDHFYAYFTFCFPFHLPFFYSLLFCRPFDCLDQVILSFCPALFTKKKNETAHEIHKAKLYKPAEQTKVCIRICNVKNAWRTHIFEHLSFYINRCSRDIHVSIFWGYINNIFLYTSLWMLFLVFISRLF